MELVQQEGANRYQKIVASIFAATLIGPLFFIFTHNFVYKPVVSKLSIYVSLVLTISSISMLAYLYFKDKWKPANAWFGYSKIKRILVIPFAPLFIYSLFWMNIAISAPHLFTLMFGVDAVKQDVVVKDRHYSRRSCKYRLEPKSISAMFFHYCISEGLYKQLPEGEIESELLIKQSLFGYFVRDVRLFRSQGNHASRAPIYLNVYGVEKSIWQISFSVLRVFLAISTLFILAWYYAVLYQSKPSKEYRAYKLYLSRAMARFGAKDYDGALTFFEKAGSLRSLEPTNRLLYERCKQRAGKA